MCVRGVSFVYVVSGHTCVLGVSVLCCEWSYMFSFVCCEWSYMCVRGVSFVYVVSGHTCRQNCHP